MVQALGPVAFGFSVLALAASSVGVWMFIRVARRFKMMDLPNARSSHSLPTPRMGGVPMVAAAAVAFGCWALLTVKGGGLSKGLYCTFLFALSMFALGFVDDMMGLSPLFRFLVQIGSVLLALWTLSPFFPGIPLGGQVLPGTFWIPLGAFWVVWMLNLYNFMDGIDGLAGGEGALASSFFFLVFAYFGEPGWAVVNLVVAAASMGFLVHNWPPAKIFMGDGGSAFLGAFYGMQSVVAHLTTSIPFPVFVLPFSNFIIDTTYTLFRRMLQGEKWYQAHRSHVYQRMTDIGMSHKEVTSIELIAVAVSCAAAAVYIGTDTWLRIADVVIVTGGFACAGFSVYRKERSLQDGRSGKQSGT